nr:hypothetical protein [Rhodococcus sp. 06-621-2]
MEVFVRQSFHRPPTFLVGLRLPKSDVDSVKPMQRDVAWEEVGEFAASEGASEPEQQDCKIAAFEDLVGPPSAAFPSGRHQGADVVDEERIPLGAAPIPAVIHSR